jgi:hypothetical protein
VYKVGVLCVTLVLWLGLSVFLAWNRTRHETREPVSADYNHDPLQIMGVITIIFTIVAVAVISFALPIVWRVDTIGATEWIHHVGVVVLGCYLAVSLYLQGEIHFKRKGPFSLDSLRSSYRTWRNVTEIMPAPAALMILASGFGLLYAKTGYSIGQGWVFAVVLILGVMMADGIFGYMIDLRTMLRDVDHALDAHQSKDTFVRSKRNRMRDAKLFIHCISYPWVVAFPALKISNGWSPASPVLSALDLSGKGGWAQVWPAIVLFGVSFLVVAALNRFGVRKSTAKESDALFVRSSFR